MCLFVDLMSVNWNQIALVSAVLAVNYWKINCVWKINIFIFFGFIASFVIPTAKGFQHFTAVDPVRSCSDVFFQFWLFWILNDCQLLIGLMGGKYYVFSIYRSSEQHLGTEKVAFLMISPVQYSKRAGVLLRENKQLRKLVVASGPFSYLFFVKTMKKLRVCRESCNFAASIWAVKRDGKSTSWFCKQCSQKCVGRCGCVYLAHRVEV